MNVIVLLGILAIAGGPVGDQPPAASAEDLVGALEAVMAKAIANAEPSVVAIHRVKTSGGGESTLAVRGKRTPRMRDGFVPFGPRGMDRLDADDLISFDFGSGVVVGGHGEILTTFHVVKGASRLIVRAADRQEFDAEIIAGDPRSDLAVIAPVAIEGVPAPKLKPIALGDPARLRKGSFLLALGNPFNSARDGKPSASWGILSNVARRLDPDVGDLNFPRRALTLPNYPTLLQLDAKLNLGMSGGAVVNLKGELVGITTSAASPLGFDAMAGYAIPMDKLGRRAVEILKQGKEIEYGLLGIRADGHYTNRVGDVQPNSPASLGQLLVGDVIVKVGDDPIADFESLILAINGYSPGQSVKLKIRRGDDLLERTVVLAKFPVDGEVIATNRPAAWRGLRVDYASALGMRAVSPLLLDAPPLAVAVIDVEGGSPAAAAGLKKGQLIREVEGKAVDSPLRFAEAIAGLEGPVTLETDLGPIVVK